MISIVVVNWNGADIIKNTIDSIIRSQKYDNFCEIIVVDNNSSDKSLDILRSYGDRISVIENEENIGFAGGCNLGARMARGNYILFLNPDTEVTFETLEQSEVFMNDPLNARVAVLGVRLVDENNITARSCARFPRAYMFIAQNLGLDRMLPRLGHTMKEWDHLSNSTVDQVIGAYFFVRRTVFDELNGFNENYFVYFEEVDFAKRAHDVGYTSYYLADIAAFHSGEGTTRKIKARRLFYSIKSRIIYGRYHYGRFENSVNIINSLIFEPISRVFYLTVSGRAGEAKFVKHAYEMIYKDIIKNRGF